MAIKPCDEGLHEAVNKPNVGPEGPTGVFVGPALRSDMGASAQALAAVPQGLDLKSASQGGEQLGVNATEAAVAHAQQVVAGLHLRQHLGDDFVYVGTHLRFGPHGQ